MDIDWGIGEFVFTGEIIQSQSEKVIIFHLNREGEVTRNKKHAHRAWFLAVKREDLKRKGALKGAGQAKEDGGGAQV